MQVKIKNVEEAIRLKDAINSCPGEILIEGVNRMDFFEKITFNKPLEVTANSLNLEKIKALVPELIVTEYTAKITIHATDLADAMSIMSKIRDVEMQYLVRTREERIMEIK